MRDESLRDCIVGALIEYSGSGQGVDEMLYAVADGQATLIIKALTEYLAKGLSEVAEANGITPPPAGGDLAWQLDRAITIKLMPRPDGGLRIRSDDIPGLVLSSNNKAAILRDLAIVVPTLISKNGLTAPENDLAWLDEIEVRAAKASLGPWHPYSGILFARNTYDLLFASAARADIPKLTAALRQALSRHKDDAGKVTDEFVEALTKAHMGANVPDLERKPEFFSVEGTYYYRDVAYDDFNAAKLAQQKDIMRIALQSALAPTEGER